MRSWLVEIDFAITRIQKAKIFFKRNLQQQTNLDLSFQHQTKMLSRVSKLTAVKILFFRYFKKGKTIKDPTAAGRKRYRSTSHRSSRSDVSVLDLSISRTETLLRSTKTKGLMACFLQMEITEFAANVVFAPCVEVHSEARW